MQLRQFPRFNEENFPKNLELVKRVENISKNKGVTIGQLAISWVRQFSGKDGYPAVLPIPGATKVERIVENSKEVNFTKDEIAEIDSILSDFEPVGGRYGGHGASFMDG